MGRITIAVVLGAALMAFGVAGCGDDDNGSATTNAPTTASSESKQQGTVLALAADPNGELKFDETSLDAKSGNVTIELENESQTPHNVAVETKDEEQLGVSDDVTEGSASLSLQKVEPGTYTFYCTLPGHREGGMEGTLTVK